MKNKITKTLLFGTIFMGLSMLLGCGDSDETGDDTDTTSAENTESACSDEIDNDSNGAVDCDDEQCAAFCKEPDWFSEVEWPEGASPKEVGKLVADNFKTKPLGDKPLYYAQAVTWYGALQVAALLEDDDLLNDLIARFDPILTEEDADYISWKQSVDDRVVGVVPLEIYINNEDDGCLEIGQGLADAQWESPQGSGISRESRFWSDDMFMIVGLQVQAFRATGDEVYLDRAALTIVKYLEALQKDEVREDNGLFWHTRSSRIHWNRGNGWAAVGMSELLSELPTDHPDYDAVMEGYTKMMADLLKYQSEEGLWVQVIDYEGEDAWLESSGSAMFTYAFITGVKNKWLDAEVYGPAAVKAWNTLVTDYLDEKGNLLGVCIGTGQGSEEGGDDLEAQLDYYMNRPTTDGDYHGQGPILFAAAALLRAPNPAEK